MQPFELPDFYMPYPARLNPHLEAARAHTKAWAREMGILDAPPDAPVRYLGRAQVRLHGLRAALRVHPSRRARPGARPGHRLVRLGLLSSTTTSWRSTSARGTGGRARSTWTGCPLFMPMDLSTRRRSRPTRWSAGLADLWQRTVPTMSDGVATPVLREHQAPARRVDVGARQHQRGPGLQPHRVHRDAPQGRRRAVVGRPRRARRRRRDPGPRSRRRRPMRVLKDTFADAVHLRNDLFSYQREIQEEGELSNGVLVVERFLERRHRSAPRTSSTTS